MCVITSFSSVQSLSCVRLFVTWWTSARQASLSITNFQSLLKLMSIESVIPANHLILCCPLLLPAIFPSIRVFSNESTLHMRWPKYWSFSFSIIPFKEIPGLISFRMDWLDLLQNGLVGSPCSPRYSQESSPTPQFKTINSLAPSFPGGSDSKVSVYNVGDLDSIPGSGRSPGEGNGNPLQYCCLENPTDRGAW